MTIVNPPSAVTALHGLLQELGRQVMLVVVVKLASHPDEVPVTRALMTAGLNRPGVDGRRVLARS